MRKWALVVLASAAIGTVSTAQAQGYNFSDRNRNGTWTAGGSIGFTLSPDLFLMGLEADYFVHHNIAVGPLLQMALDDNVFLFSPTCNVRGVFDIPGNGFAHRVKPFVQGGAGLTMVDVSFPGGGNTDVSFLINFGFGADIYLTDHFSLGNNLLFNITPNFGDHFYFAWQFVTARYHF